MKRIITILACFLLALPTYATHIIGAEIGYKHLSGLQYEVYVNIYGDCSGASFPTITTTTMAEVYVYNGPNSYTTINCVPYGNYGQEITPVCPSDSNNTKCKSATGTIPGVAEFKYKALVTLNQLSANWRFAFGGQLINAGAAGRSNAITNILIGTNGSIVYIEAALNNVNGPNNSPLLTTIPTPFFCINQPQEYNPGAVDADGDSLSFTLVPGLEPSGTSGVQVTYLGAYSGNQPLAASSFNFSNLNGQLSFVPNLNQTSLVVNRIEEYKNGILVGSMMREMNFVVLNNCNNQSPNGVFTSSSNGSIKSPNVIEICNADSLFSFRINAQDPDTGNVHVTVSGLPAGMTYVINGNNTLTPSIDFNFAVPTPIMVGTLYPFFITFQDDGCPLSSKQQIAYTIKVIQPINFVTTIIPEGCFPGADGIANIAGSSSNVGTLEYSFNNGPFNPLNTFTNLTNGTYPIAIRDADGCVLKSSLYVDSAIAVKIDSIASEPVSCFGKNDGVITVSTTPIVANTFYSVMPTFRTSAGRFDFMPPGLYTVIAHAPFGCRDTATIEISSPPPIAFNNIVIEDNICNLRTGRIEINTNIAIPVAYSISPNQQTNSYGQFGGLSAGYYILTALDSNGCYKDTILEVKDRPNNFGLSFTKQHVSCASDGNDGWAAVEAFNGIAPYTYLWQISPAATETSSRINNQRSGLKRVFVTDAIGCKTDGYVIVEPANCCEKVFIPSGFTPNGDGQNESFKMRTPLTMKDVNFFVVNRWGQKVWQTNNHLDSWDGTYGNGNTADVGTYFYYLSYRCDEDDTNTVYKLKGDITLIR